MPIAPELRQFYGPTWRKEVRPRILARAQDACECCGKPNHKTVRTLPGGLWFDEYRWDKWRSPGSELIDLRPPSERGVFTEGPNLTTCNADTLSILFETGGLRYITVVLTVAHVNQISGDDRDENLAALCQWCHLSHDRMQHARNARMTRCTRKDSSRPLLAGLTPQTQTPPLGEE
jgi:hypothetical protein